MKPSDELLNFLSTENWARKLSKNPSFKHFESELIELTNFLPIYAINSQRGWHLLNDNYTIQLCKTCQITQVRYDIHGKQYKNFCSAKCSANDRGVRDKFKSAVVSKYGVDNPSKVFEIKEKKKQTCIKNHGVEYSLQSPKIRGEFKKTNLERYGVENPMQSLIFQEKTTKTNLERYGHISFSKTDEFKEINSANNISKYGVEHYFQSDEFKEISKQTNLERYGVDNSAKYEPFKEKAKQTNKEKYDRDYPTQVHISQEILDNLNNHDWMYNEHITNKKSLLEISKELDISDCTVANYFYNHGIELQTTMRSIKEKELATFLANNFSCELNTRKVIPPYELDIYIPEHRLAIEYCGLFWHSEINKPTNYHQRKYRLCKEKGIRLITIFENEYMENEGIVKDKLLSILNKSDKVSVFARKTSIVEVCATQKQYFFNTNHIQGDGPSSINYGLTYNDELVACIGFIKHKDYFILNRYATSCNVPGGFSKLLKYFKTQYKTVQIVTFADLRWSEGDLYKNSGFTMDKELKPDYYWAKGTRLWHKFNWRHTTGLRKLQHYDSNLSESENMKANGYYKIWDCGKLRFVIP